MHEGAAARAQQRGYFGDCRLKIVDVLKHGNSKDDVETALPSSATGMAAKSC